MDLSEQSQVAMATPTVAGSEITLPLSVLYRDALNVRKKGGKSVEGLAALIYSQSLLQNLVVRAERAGKGKKQKPTGRYGVVAGGRRLDALNLLLSQRKIAEDYPVRCLLVSDEDALSVSLAENSEREPLHGADLFDAFQAMVEMGKSVEQIADAWGLTTLTVERRLRLAAISPKLMALYREDGIQLDQLIALTIAEDHATQESVWENAPPYQRDAHSLKRMLTAREVTGTSPLARCVGVDAYKAAGGPVRQDLFSEEDGSGCFLSDVALLERLAMERLTAHAEALREAEGWAWAEGRLRFDWADRRAFVNPRTIVSDLTPEQQARLDALDAARDELEAKWQALEEDEDDSDLVDEQDQIEAEREAIASAATQIDPRDKQVAGVIVFLNGQGSIEEAKGLVRAEDQVEDDEVEGEGDDGAMGRSGHGQEPAAKKPEFSERLQRQLTAHRTAAVRACLVDTPDVALRVLAYQLATLVFCQRDYSSRLDRPVEIRAEFAVLEKDAPDLPASQAQADLDAHRDRIGNRLPGDQAALLRWMLNADSTDVLDVLAYCTASAFNAVQGREGPQPVADQIAQALQLDMADWWKPTRESYLGAVPKAKVIEAVAEATSVEQAAVLEGMKKDALAAEAERRLEGTRWLPKPLRGSAT